MLAALRLHDAVDDPCVVSPQEGGRLAVKQPYKREDVGSIGCMAEGTEHGMPTNEVVGPDTINRKDSQGGVHLALELEAVCEGFGASTGSKCILVGPGGNIECRGEVLSQSPGNQPAQVITDHNAPNPTASFANGNEPPQTKGLRNGCWQLCTCEAGGNRAEGVDRGRVIQNE